MTGGPREQTNGVLKAHVWDENQCRCSCGERDEANTRQWDYTEEQWAEHVADAVSLALGLTEERRTLTDGWIQPFRNAGYISQGLKPPPAVITHEARWVSGWSVVGGEPT